MLRHSGTRSRRDPRDAGQAALPDAAPSASARHCQTLTKKSFQGFEASSSVISRIKWWSNLRPCSIKGSGRDAGSQEFRYHSSLSLASTQGLMVKTPLSTTQSVRCRGEIACVLFLSRTSHAAKRPQQCWRMARAGLQTLRTRQNSLYSGGMKFMRVKWLKHAAYRVTSHALES